MCFSLVQRGFFSRKVCADSVPGLGENPRTSTSARAERLPELQLVIGIPMPAAIRQCLHCGMTVPAPRLHFDALPPALWCPKCDQNLYLQSNGSCLTRDIAHQRETIVRALDKLDALLLEGWCGNYQTIRIIVGGGVIREQVLGQLHYHQQQGRLLACREESPNKGAILVTLRQR
jgi:hypothetical protein